MFGCNANVMNLKIILVSKPTQKHEHTLTAIYTHTKYKYFFKKNSKINYVWTKQKGIKIKRNFFLFLFIIFQFQMEISCYRILRNQLQTQFNLINVYLLLSCPALVASLATYKMK